ncbi:hypothetical protein KAW65_07500 [candidate division WOR-3 bacterium]|nr:hypothetical protein [candidate division WOR-3 bacterium]
MISILWLILATVGAYSNTPLQIFLSEKPVQVFKEHKTNIYSVAFNPSSELLASGSKDGIINVWRIKDGSLLHTLNHGSQVRSVCFSPDNLWIVSSGRNGLIKIWDFKSDRSKPCPYFTIDTHQERVYSVCFDPAGEWLASAGKNHTIKIWSIPDFNLLRTLPGHEDLIYSLFLSLDGSPRSGNFLISGSKDKTVRIWRTSDWGYVGVLKSHKGRVYSVSISPDDKIIASGSEDNTIKLWDTDSLKLFKTLKTHQNYVRTLAFSPEYPILASGSLDRTLRLWNLEGKLLATRNFESGLWDVKFSPNSEWLAVASGTEIYIFTVFTPGRKIASEGPPKLTFTSTIQDENSNKILEAGELVNLIIEIINEGKGYADEVKVFVETEETDLAAFEQSKFLGMIAPGDTKVVDFKALIPYSIRNWDSYIHIKVCSPELQSLKEKIFVKTKALLPPNFNIVYNIDDSDGNANGIIDRGEPVKLRVKVQNLGEAIARDVKVLLSTETEGLSLTKTEQNLGAILAKSSQITNFIFKVSKDFKEESFIFFLKVKEKSGFFTAKKEITLFIAKPKIPIK